MSADLALDLGSASARLWHRDGPVVDEPNLAAVDLDSGRLVAFGAAAQTMGAGAAGRIRVVRPVRRGQIADIGLGDQVLAALLRRAGVHRLAKARVLVGLHLDATSVQRRSLERALDEAGARTVRFVELPIGVALGAGLAIEEPAGTMVIEVGAAVSDIAVLALGGIVTSASLPLGGGDLEDAVRSVLARHHGLLVDRATAAEVLAMIGTLEPIAVDERVEVLGREISSGRMATAILQRSDVRAVLGETLSPLYDAAVRCIAQAPPDLANDLLGTGIVLAGGTSVLEGLAHRLAGATGLSVRVAPDPRRCAVGGVARCVDLLDLEELQPTRRR